MLQVGFEAIAARSNQLGNDSTEPEADRGEYDESLPLHGYVRTPMPYKFNWESKNTLWVKFDGKVSFTDLTKASDNFYNDDRSDHLTGVFWDFTGMESFDVGKDDATEIAFTDDVASQYMKPIKAAFITTDAKFSELAKHYIRVMEQLGSKWKNRPVFLSGGCEAVDCMRPLLFLTEQ